MTVGGLRRAVINGEVLSSQVFDALLKQAPEIAAEFEKLAPTIGRQIEPLKNSFMSFLGQLDDATGLTGKIADEMKSLSEFLQTDFSTELDSIADKFSAIAVITETWEQAFSDAADGIKALSGEGDAFGDGMKKTFDDITVVLWRSVLEWLPNVRLLFQTVVLTFMNQLSHGKQFILTLVNATEIAWVSIEQAGAAVVNAIKLAWAIAADQVVMFFASGIERVADLARNIPFFGEQFEVLGTIAKDIKELATNEEEARKIINQGTQDYEARRKALEGTRETIEATGKAERKFNQEALDAAVDARHADVALIDLKLDNIKKEREARKKAQAAQKALDQKAANEAAEQRKKELEENAKAAEAKEAQEKARKEREREVKSLQPQLDSLINSLSTRA